MKIEAVSIDFPAIAFTHMYKNYYFIVKLIRFSSLINTHARAGSYRISIKILLVRYSVSPESWKTKKE